MYRKKIKDTGPEVYSTLKNELIKHQNKMDTCSIKQITPSATCC